MINYPIDCTTEASRLSFLFKLLIVYRDWFNNRGLGMDSIATLRRDSIHRAIEEQSAIAEDINIHAMSGLSNGKVVFPPSVTHEGSRLSALFALDKIIKGAGSSRNEDFQIKQAQAITEAENGTQWNPIMEDIVDE